MILKHFLIFSEDDEGIEDVIRNFSFQSKCIASLYERCFSKFHTENIKQINIRCVKGIPKPTITVDGFCDVEIPYDVNEFFNLDDQVKKRVILDKLKQGIDKVAELYNWETIPFDDAYNLVREAGYNTNYVWKIPKSSPKRTHNVEVFIEHGLYLCNIYLIVKDKNGLEIAKRIVASEKPDELIFNHYLGVLKWFSNDEAALFNKPKTNYVSIHLKDGRSSTNGQVN